MHILLIDIIFQKFVTLTLTVLSYIYIFNDFLDDDFLLTRFEEKTGRGKKGVKKLKQEENNIEREKEEKREREKKWKKEDEGGEGEDPSEAYANLPIPWRSKLSA